MREVFTASLDVTTAVMRRYSMIYLLCGVLPLKERWVKREKWVLAGFVVVSMVFYLISNYLPAVKMFFYGSTEGMLASILPMAISLSIMLIYCCFFYSGKKSRICYMACTAYTLNELVMFTIQPLLSIILSALILKKLVESSEKELLLEVYRNRIGDMEEHMKDVERLYDGIRGMRHDMKNCVADLEILLQNKKRISAAGECVDHEDPGEYEAEVRRYLDGMCLAIDELDMKCSTGNPVTDVVLSRKIRRAEQEKMPFPAALRRTGQEMFCRQVSLILQYMDQGLKI